MSMLMAVVDVDLSVAAAVRGCGHGCSCVTVFPPLSFPGLFSCGLVRRGDATINGG